MMRKRKKDYKITLKKNLLTQKVLIIMNMYVNIAINQYLMNDYLTNYRSFKK